MRRFLPALALLLPIPAATQENANPWLNQREMFGQATFTIRGGGSESKSNSTYRVDRHIQVDFRLQFDPGQIKANQALRQILSGPLGANIPAADRKKMEAQVSKYIWAAAPRKKEQTRRIRINDFQADGRESTTLLGSEEFEETATSVIIIDIAANTCDLSIGLPDYVDMTETVQGKKPYTRKGLQTIGKELSRVEEKNRVLPAPGGIISGSRDISKDLERFRPSSSYGEISGTLDWVLSPKPFEPLELVLDIEGYDKWLPNAGAAEGEDGPDKLKVVASLRNKGAGAVTDKMESLTIVLTDVSDEPGIACNWPLRPKQGDRIRDLWFPPDANQGFTRIRDQGLVLRAVKPGTSATAVIASRDWGAWGILHADAHLESGRRLDGFTPSLPKNPRIPIPKRKKDSRVADAWKKPPVDGHPDEWDGEDGPSTKDMMAGDGLTLYEEYRGFLVGGKHVRGDPEKRDFFVVDLNLHPKVKKGIGLFASLTGMAVHSDLKPEELGMEAADKPGTRLINANSREVRIVDQHGVVIEPLKDLAGKSIAGAYGDPKDDRARGTPKDYFGIQFSRKVADEEWPAVKRANGEIRPPVSLFEITVAHELLHTVAVPHHGDSDIDHVKWDIQKGPDGRWTITENGKPITMVNEDGSPFQFTKAVETLARVGKPGGLYSGNEDCVMRYFNADAYVDPKNADVRINIRGTDSPGRSLCTGAAGTGMNAPAWFNGGRFKDATVGNCRSLICVNDRYICK